MRCCGRMDMQGKKVRQQSLDVVSLALAASGRADYVLWTEVGTVAPVCAAGRPVGWPCDDPTDQHRVQ
eukprot:COSAG01_NODE_65697_length_272_cov_1.023121_1_plen_67_part_10